MEADPEAVEAVSEILGREAAGGVAIEAAVTVLGEGLAARPDPSRPAVVRAYLPTGDVAAQARAAAAVEAAERALGHLQAFGLRPIGPLTTRAVHEEDWAAGWRRHVPVLRIGRRLVIRPSWRRHRPREDEVVIVLDPGMAFGTGLHPTTRLCLTGVEAWADAGLLTGRTFLDVGCGSGILSLAALRLGARLAVGLDPDPLAVAATEANARRNRLGPRVRAVEGSLPAPDGPYDLVAANLVAGLLVELADALADAVRPAGGRLLAGGIFADREDEVRRALAGAGLEIVGRREEGDWLTLEARRA